MLWICCDPRLDVMMMTVLRKSTVRPWPSVRRPSSSTCNSTLNTSGRSEEHTSELQSLMRISYAVFCLKQKIQYYFITSNYSHQTPQINDRTEATHTHYTHDDNICHYIFFHIEPHST